MIKTFSFLSLAVAVVATSGCATNAASRRHDQDMVAAVSAVLTYVQRDGPSVKLIRGSNVTDPQWAVLSRSLPIGVTPDRDSNVSLAEGSFRLDEIDMRKDSAHVVGVLGPVPRPRPGVLLACGQNYTLWVNRNGSTWRVLAESLVVC
jgi:hypothetical protein